MARNRNDNNDNKLTLAWRVIIEVGFIIFLFYSNLLMGEFNHSGQAQTKGLLWALKDIFTIENFTIAIITGLIGHLAFEVLRKRL